MVRAIILGQGMVATHLVVGVERIKAGELKPYGVPLAGYQLPYKVSDIEFVASYDVDPAKVGKNLHELCKEMLNELPVPETLKKLKVREGIHLGSLVGLIESPLGLERTLSLKDAIDKLVDEWVKLEPDVFVNVITTEPAKRFNEVTKLEKAIEEGKGISASHAYAYAAAMYAKETGRPISFINVIPTPLANDPAVVELYKSVKSVILGDDGATGATPLTADLLEHMAQRNRYVEFIVQFNIGGNTDFLSLTVPERNKMKEFTKSSIVEDILGYNTPHYIKPTGYLEPLGDKKFVSIHMEYITFNGLRDSFYVNVRLNDSPALAGKLVDLIRLGKIATDKGATGTIYEINAFYMKKPGPIEAKSVAKIVAYYRLLEWLKNLGIEVGKRNPIT